MNENRDPADGLTPDLDEALAAVEDRLRRLEPGGVSPAFRERLLTPPILKMPAASRWDRGLKLAFPWACAACLAVGFFWGTSARSPQAPINEPMVPPRTSVADSTPSDLAGPYMQEVSQRDQQGRRRAESSDLSSLSDPFVNM